jgi:hypothetical protein
MSKKTNKYLPLMCLLVIVIITAAVVLIYKYFKKENFEENDNIQKALKLANYAGSQGIDLSNKPKLLKAEESYPENLTKIQCPGGICPGLGAGFDLRKKNINDPSQFLSGKKPIFKNTNIKDNKCFLYHKEQKTEPSNNYTKNTRELLRAIATSNELSASAPIETVTLAATANAATRSSVTENENIQTTELSIVDRFGSVSFLENIECRFDNLTDDFKSEIETLSNISITKPSESNSWIAFSSFFEKYGTHVMTQIVFGSKLQFWESIINSTTDSQNILQIKACLKAHENISNISAGVCSGYSKDEIDKANKTSTNSRAYILGGGDEIRKKISNLYLNGKSASQEDIDEFLKTSNESNQAVGYIFVPIWKLILSMYIGVCVDNYLKNVGGKSTSCKITQLAINLEAAFAFNSIKCEKLSTGYGKIYQEFREIKTDNPLKEYQCFAAKTGCTNDDDCNYNWDTKANTGCIAYGAGTLEKGDEYEMNPGNYRTKVQGGKGSNNPYDGINNSCYERGYMFGCVCNDKWAGGLPDRSLWKSGD